MSTHLTDFASDQQIYRSLLLGIATHPLIVDSPVRHPITNQTIKIEKFRGYAGRELASPGFTLSVYPSYSPNRTGHSRKAVTGESTTLGNSHEYQRLEKMVHAAIVQVTVLDAEFDTPMTIRYQQSASYPGEPHSESITTIPDGQTRELYSRHLERPVEEKELEIYVIPAEEIIRQFGTLLRLVLRDNRTYRPLRVRNPMIRTVDYDTSELFEATPENIVFHRCRIEVQFDIYELPVPMDDLPEVYYLRVDNANHEEVKTYSLTD